MEDMRFIILPERKQNGNCVNDREIHGESNVLSTTQR